MIYDRIVGTEVAVFAMRYANWPIYLASLPSNFSPPPTVPILYPTARLPLHKNERKPLRKLRTKHDNERLYSPQPSPLRVRFFNVLSSSGKRRVRVQAAETILRAPLALSGQRGRRQSQERRRFSVSIGTARLRELGSTARGTGVASTGEGEPESEVLGEIHQPQAGVQK